MKQSDESQTRSPEGYHTLKLILPHQGPFLQIL